MTREEYGNGSYIPTTCLSTINLERKMSQDPAPNSLRTWNTALSVAMVKCGISWREQGSLRMIQAVS